MSETRRTLYVLGAGLGLIALILGSMMLGAKVTIDRLQGTCLVQAQSSNWVLFTRPNDDSHWLHAIHLIGKWEAQPIYVGFTPDQQIQFSDDGAFVAIAKNNGLNGTITVVSTESGNEWFKVELNNFAVQIKAFKGPILTYSTKMSGLTDEKWYQEDIRQLGKSVPVAAFAVHQENEKLPLAYPQLAKRDFLCTDWQSVS